MLTPALLGFARAIDSTDIGALWVTDHFSGAVADKPFSRDPFVALGALAAVTERVDLGLLVANINNRHPVQLASAINSLQSLAPGRIRLGMGSGAVSRFSIRGRTRRDRNRPDGHRSAPPAPARPDSCGPGDLAGRRRFSSPTLSFAGLTAVVDGHPAPRIVVGASAWATIEVAVEEADGVNIRFNRDIDEQVARIRRTRDDVGPGGFEISVLLDPARGELDVLAGHLDHLRSIDVERR